MSDISNNSLPAVEAGVTFTSRRGMQGDDSDSVLDRRILRATPLYPTPAIEPFTAYDLDPADNSALAVYIRSGFGLTTKPINEATKFLVCQSVQPNMPEMTRGGFLAVERDDQLVPLTAMVSDQPYYVEVKGVGHSGGGYSAYQDKFFRNVILGGMRLDKARLEYENLRRAYEAGISPLVPLAVGQIATAETLRDEEDNLGIVFRLSPSITRLSYRDLPSSLKMENREDMTVVLEKLVDNFLDKFSREPDAPVFISPASHLENYLVYGDGQITETDFEDFRELGSPEIPFVHTQTGSFIDTRAIIGHYFFNFSVLDHFDTTRDLPALVDMLQEKLAARDVAVGFSECETAYDIGHALWEQWLVKLEHEARLKQNYTPSAMVDFIASNDLRVSELHAKYRGQDIEQLPSRQVTNKEFDAGEDGDKYAELIDLVSTIGWISETPKLKNGERYSAVTILRQDFKQKLSGLGEEIGWDKLPEIMFDLAAEIDENCELTARVFGGLSYFQNYLDSEINYGRRIAEDQTGQQSSRLTMLENIRLVVGLIMESDDWQAAKDFFDNQLVRLMQLINQSWAPDSPES